jgi:hypothetical protein
VKIHSGRYSAYKHITLLCARHAQAVDKNSILDPGIDNILQTQAETACGVHRLLLNEVSVLLDAVALWNSATYDEGMAHVRTLTVSLSESSQNFEVCHKPMTTLLEKAKQKGLVAAASKRASR